MKSDKANITSLYLILCSILLALLFCCEPIPDSEEGNFQFSITFSSELNKETLDGRLLLLISSNDDREPRFQISDGAQTQLVFGIDVEELEPGEAAIFDKNVFGYPLKSIAEIPLGNYWVQALLHKYETFTRSDGHVVKLPMDRGEGQHWNRAPGNLYSTPEKVRINPGSVKTIEIELDKKIPPIDPPKDTKYIKHVKIQSDLLTEFWELITLGLLITSAIFIIVKLLVYKVNYFLFY